MTRRRSAHCSLCWMVQAEESKICYGPVLLHDCFCAVRMGSLGLRSAARMSLAANCASWADCLRVIQSRHPEWTHRWRFFADSARCFVGCIRLSRWPHSCARVAGSWIQGRHRRDACSMCGVLRRRTRPLEKAAAPMCREAGARVAENVFFQDMTLLGRSRHDSRQLEVMAKTVSPLWHGPSSQ